MARAVVVNQLPLLHFYQASSLGILTEIYSEVLLPNALWGQATCPAIVLDDVIRHHGFHRAEPVAGIEDADPALTSVDREAMRLASEAGAMLLLEGRHIRQVARRHGLESTGTLGLLLQAQATGLLGSVDDWLPHFRKSGLLVGAKTEKIVRALAANPANNTDTE